MPVDLSIYQRDQRPKDVFDRLNEMAKMMERGRQAQRLARPAAAVANDGQPVIAGAGGPLTDRAAHAVDFYMQHGLTREQAAGLVGNLQQEAFHDLRTTVPGDAGTAIGVGQWREGRQKNLKAFAKANGLDVADLDTQLLFSLHEMGLTDPKQYGAGNGFGSEAATGRALRAATTVDEATAAGIGYERPKGWTANNPHNGHGWNNRLTNAQTIFGASPTTVAEAPSAAAPLGPLPEAAPVPRARPDGLAVAAPVRPVTPRTLRHGDYGNEVLQAQRFLNDNFSANINEDSDYGKETERAISAFQRAQGLRDTGKLNSRTWNEMFRIAQVPMAPVPVAKPNMGMPAQPPEGGPAPILLDKGQYQDRVPDNGAPAPVLPIQPSRPSLSTEPGILPDSGTPAVSPVAPTRLTPDPALAETVTGALEVPAAARGVQVAQADTNTVSDADPLWSFKFDNENIAPGSPAPKSDDPFDPLGTFHPMEAEPGPGPIPVDKNWNWNEAANAGLGGIINGIPVVGPIIKEGANRAGAYIRSLTSGKPYDEELSAVHEAVPAIAEKYPLTSGAGNIIGGVAAGGAAGMTGAGARLMGITGTRMVPRMLTSGATGAVVGGTDQAVRDTISGDGIDFGNIGRAAAMGGAFGLVGPVLQDTVGHYAQNLPPLRAAPAAGRELNRLQQATGRATGSIPDFDAAFARNPNLSAMNIDPILRNGTGGMGIMAQPSAAQDIMTNNLLKSAGMTNNAVRDAYRGKLGATPNSQQLVDGLANTAATNAKIGFGQALVAAKPVDTAPAMQIITEHLGDGGPVGDVMRRYHRQLMLDDGPVYDADILGNIQSDMRKEAQRLMKAGGSDYTAGEELMRARQQLVNQIDDATGGRYKPALKQYADDIQVRDAFDEGMSILSNRTGANGLQDRPEAWQKWWDSLSAPEQEAARAGTLTAIDGVVRRPNGGNRGMALPEGDINREKFEVVFGKDATDDLVRAMQDARSIQETNGPLINQGISARMEAAGRSRHAKEPTSIKNIIRGAGGVALDIAPAAAALYGLSNMKFAAAGLLPAALRHGANWFRRGRARRINNTIAQAISEPGGAAYRAALEAARQHGARMRQAGGVNILLRATQPRED